MKQLPFASLAYTSKNEENAQREVSWRDGKHCSVARNLETIIEPIHPKRGRRGRQPMPMKSMLRIYFMQQRYALSDPGMEDALYDTTSPRRFAGLELFSDAMPDETTILNFRGAPLLMTERYAMVSFSLKRYGGIAILPHFL